jgi:hypothetical protein
MYGSTILILHKMEVHGQPRAPAATFQGRHPWCPFDRRLGGPGAILDAVE